MHFRILLTLGMLLFLTKGSSLYSMENGEKPKKKLPFNSQRKPRPYDSFVSQFDLPSKKAIEKFKKGDKKKRKSKDLDFRAFISRIDAIKEKKSKKNNATCKKTEIASALLAIEECTCHQKADDQSSPN